MRVAIKVNTGLNRFGFNISEIKNSALLIKKLNLSVNDIYTHLASSISSNQNDYSFTQTQYQSFLSFIKKISQYLDLKNVNTHFADSATILRSNKLSSAFDSVRTGMFILGLDPIYNINEKIVELDFSIQLKVLLLYKCSVKKDMFYSYDKKAKENINIGTISIGYCDGMRKSWIGQNIINSNFGKLKLLDVSMNTSIIEIPQEAYNVIEPLKDQFTIFSTQEDLLSLANFANTSIEDITCGFYSINNVIKYQ